MSDSKFIKLDKKQILDYQKNRDPYLMIDQATEVIPGVSANGFKDLKSDEWFFKCHWEGDPNMPGMLQIEALVQMAALAIVTLPGNKGKAIYLASADKIKFKTKVTAGNRFYIKTKIINWSRGVGRCEGFGLIDEKMVCEAQFLVTEPSTLKQFIK